MLIDCFNVVALTHVYTFAETISSQARKSDLIFFSYSIILRADTIRIHINGKSGIIRTGIVSRTSCPRDNKGCNKRR